MVLPLLPAMVLTGCVRTPEPEPGSAPCSDEDRTELTVRNGHAMAYDEQRDRLILFGGADDCRVRGDTWARGDGPWQRLSVDGPSPRTFPVMARDAARGELVLFGGNEVLFGTEAHPPTMLADTWVLRDSLWERRSPGTSPSARAEAGLAYDPSRRRSVLFGGYRLDGDSILRLADTWEWDGERWEEVAATGPAARNGAAMAYDPVSARVLLFGGAGATSDTWAWDGRAWTQVAPGGDVPGRFDSEMAYHPGSGGVVRFGGWDGEQRVDDTWLWSRGRWTLLADSGPPARNHTALIPDPSHDRLLLFGGHDGPRVFGDLWQWSAEGWRLIRPHEPRTRIDNGH